MIVAYDVTEIPGDSPVSLSTYLMHSIFYFRTLGVSVKTTEE